MSLEAGLKVKRKQGGNSRACQVSWERTRVVFVDLLSARLDTCIRATAVH